MREELNVGSQFRVEIKLRRVKNSAVVKFSFSVVSLTFLCLRMSAKHKTLMLEEKIKVIDQHEKNKRSVKELAEQYTLLGKHYLL